MRGGCIFEMNIITWENYCPPPSWRSHFIANGCFLLCRLLKQLDFPSMTFTLYFMGYEKAEDIPSDETERTQWMFTRKATVELTQWVASQSVEEPTSIVPRLSPQPQWVASQSVEEPTTTIDSIASLPRPCATPHVTKRKTDGGCLWIREVLHKVHTISATTHCYIIWGFLCRTWHF